MGLAARLLRNLDAGHAGHLDVEEQNVRRVLLKGAQRLDAVPGLCADDEIGPELREGFPKLGAQHRLILGDDRLQWAHRVSDTGHTGSAAGPDASVAPHTVASARLGESERPPICRRRRARFQCTERNAWEASRMPSN